MFPATETHEMKPAVPLVLVFCKMSIASRLCNKWQFEHNTSFVLQKYPQKVVTKASFTLQSFILSHQIPIRACDIQVLVTFHLGFDGHRQFDEHVLHVRLDLVHVLLTKLLHGISKRYRMRLKTAGKSVY